jgi:hypothetical protein
MSSVILSPPIIIVGTQTASCVAGCEQSAASFITQCSTTYGESAFYSPHRVVASRRGPRTNILLSRTSNLARGSDVDCLIRHSLKFCQRRAGFSGSLLGKKTPTLCGDRHGTKGDYGHALAIGESASITIAKKRLIGSGIAIFHVVCQVGPFFFSSAETSDHHDSLHTIGTIGYQPLVVLLSDDST